ncbi:4a-hydroxytetrahydrobiopterin dehydratase [Tessaracoccus sp. MC1679]|uniref:VOC family protein n=1 Tax=Tessaracoccus sp. MC1679 TaxID=2760313 RepID=UPI001601B122|nr:VOC family protein [Tessaracoccus sp. MC1679]MBB1514774.1 4a-hydroxytetrahydrobiopterin dehydratase [Tessaracoccus sp. MC1679]
MALSRKQASAALPVWRYLLGRMHLTVDAGSFPSALAFVNDVARIAEEHNHHPEIDLRYSRVHLAVASHDAGGITERDVAFGSAVADLVTARGLEAVTSDLAEIEIAIDALDIPVVLPFWRAITGYADDGPEALADPLLIGPPIWFQQMDEPRPQRNRIHIDLTLPHDEVRTRLDRALAAGGTLLSDAAAPSFWVLSDPEGNEVCLCTWQGRDEWDALDA